MSLSTAIYVGCYIRTIPRENDISTEDLELLVGNDLGVTLYPKKGHPEIWFPSSVETEDLEGLLFEGGALRIESDKTDFQKRQDFLEIYNLNAFIEHRNFVIEVGVVFYEY